MSSLQVRDDHGNWRYVKHVPGAVIVHPPPYIFLHEHLDTDLIPMQINCGTFMQWYTGGYFKAANHRVTAPPRDQRNHTRLGVFYFVVPNDDDKVSGGFPSLDPPIVDDRAQPNTLLESPVLQRAGVQAVFPPGGGVTTQAFSRARVAKVGKSEMYKKDWGNGEILTEVIGECGRFFFGMTVVDSVVAGVEVPHYG